MFFSRSNAINFGVIVDKSVASDIFLLNFNESKTRLKYMGVAWLIFTSRNGVDCQPGANAKNLIFHQ